MPYHVSLPQITQLSVSQQQALNEKEPLNLSGGPGTGKSLVSLWRHIRNYNLNAKRSLLLTYTLSLEHYLRQTVREESEAAASHVSRTYKWLSRGEEQYDEIILDEGQDIWKPDFERLFEYTENIAYGADRRQSIYLDDTQTHDLFTWLNSDERFKNNVSIELFKNYRNSREILLFIRALFPHFVIHRSTIKDAPATNLKPVIKRALGNEPSSHALYAKQVVAAYTSPTHNIGILVPLRDQVDYYLDKLSDLLGQGTAITAYRNGLPFASIENVHITTYKSAKGLEFDTVILPEFDKYVTNIAAFNWVSEELYYVAITRAKRNLFLLCSDAALPMDFGDSVNYE